MTPKRKIAVIVGLQIILIVTSFMVLVIIETEWSKTGNAIDRAGLNRFLTSNAILESFQPGFFDNAESESIKKLENNIQLIKDGGEIEGKKLNKLPPELLEQWSDVDSKFSIFRQSIENLKETLPEKRPSHYFEINEKANNLIESSNKLVGDIADFRESIDQILIKLQIILLIINTVVHIGLVILIFNILNKEANEKIKLQKFAIIGELGASIVHDLRNPLTAIKGSFEILQMKKNEPINEIERKQYEKINNSIEKIEFLAKGILDYSKTQKLKKEKTSFLEIINDSINEIKIPDEIKINISKIDKKINVDKIKLQTVISNLIKNSISAIEGEGTITIKIDEDYDHVTCLISDSGKGFDAKEIPKIFEPLYSTKQSGTGLGLSNSKRIIEEHGGKITVKINPTTFKIELPKK